MKKISAKTSYEIKNLRRSGLSHRQIAKKLNVSLGTAFFYSEDIRLTQEQHLFLKRFNLKKNLCRLSKNQRIAFSKKGGHARQLLYISPYSKEKIIIMIRDFYLKHKRIPLKKEFLHEKVSRKIFGSWNKAIIATGFKPNPVKFAEKHIANDGHKCDSFAEKIIDDWLFAQNIPHQTKVPYDGTKMTADFQIGNTLIEFFGLKGEIEKYDKNVQEKEKIVKERKLSLIKIYPEDLFPRNQLDEIFSSFSLL